MYLKYECLKLLSQKSHELVFILSPLHAKTCCDLISTGKIYKYDSHVPITIECTTNEHCSGTSDTCNSGICYCGSKEKCVGRTDTCTAGQCKCGAVDECTSTEACYLGACMGN